jgi:hypothetical protein
MASISTRPTPFQTAEMLAERFQRLAAAWRVETAFLSSSTRMAEHPAYQEIIQMGPPVVPLILADLAQKPDHWFSALRTITGANPVDPGDSGRLDVMAEAWLRWGREHGYQW